MGKLDWAATLPDPRTRITRIPFMCHICGELVRREYTLPTFLPHLVRNVLRDIHAVVDGEEWTLIGPITLNPPTKVAEVGTQLALSMLREEGIVAEGQTAPFTFRLTLLGWIALNHSAY